MDGDGIICLLHPLDPDQSLTLAMFSWSPTSSLGL